MRSTGMLCYEEIPSKIKAHALLSESGMPLRIESSLSENLASG